ncbi:MAG: hypothetical protein JJE30_01110 [Desulfuromonadales bacterium]|nr:hypothetical protein [Desulfuromonadales bacterium]
MLTRIALICLLTSFSSVPVSMAASLVEVVRPQAFLQYEGLRQRVSLLYEYTGRHTGNTSSTVNRFQEKYHIGSAFSILNPDLLHIDLGGDLIYDQASLSQDSSNPQKINYQYSVDATAFTANPYPVTVSNARNSNTVVTAFLPAYTATTDSTKVGLRLVNNILPLQLRYIRTTTDTQGLQQDSLTTGNGLLLLANHTYRDISSSELTLTYDDSRSKLAEQVTNSRNYSLAFSNSVSMDQAKRYSLGTNVQAQDSIQGLVLQRSATITEILSGRFGAALRGNLTYEHSYNKSLGFDGSDQVQQTDSGTAALSHKLFQSLESRLRGHYQERSVFGGTETTYGESIYFGYRKTLPKQSILTFNAGTGRETVIRAVGSSVLAVRDELHSQVQQGQVITLSLSGRLGSVVSIKSRNPEILYVEGRDYSVNLLLGRIEILNGGTIVPGTDLFISYQVLINPQVAYSTDSIILSSTLSILKNRYQLSGDMSTQSVTSSGGDPNLSLYASTSFRIRLDANYTDNTLSTEYTTYESGPTKYSYLSGSWRYLHQMPLSVISFNVQDRYSMNGSTTAGGGTSTENNLSAGSTYSRNLFSWAKLVLSLNYANNTSNRGSSDYVFFKTTLNGHINRLDFHLAGQTIWRVSSGQNSRDDNLHFDISRTF